MRDTPYTQEVCHNGLDKDGALNVWLPVALENIRKFSVFVSVLNLRDSTRPSWWTFKYPIFPWLCSIGIFGLWYAGNDLITNVSYKWGCKPPWRFFICSTNGGGRNKFNIIFLFLWYSTFELWMFGMIHSSETVCPSMTSREQKLELSDKRMRVTVLDKPSSTKHCFLPNAAGVRTYMHNVHSLRYRLQHEYILQAFCRCPQVQIRPADCGLRSSRSSSKVRFCAQRRSR